MPIAMHSFIKALRLLVLGFLLLGFSMSSSAMAQGFYGGSEYLDRPPPPPPPTMGEFTHLPPPPPPPASPGNAWQREGYRQGDMPAPWASPLWGIYRNPRLSRLHGWDSPAFLPWGGYISSQDPYPGMVYPPSSPSRSCVDQSCTGP